MFVEGSLEPASVERLPLSELYADLPSRSSSLYGEDQSGRPIIARLGVVRNHDRDCVCCSATIEVGDGSVLTKVIDPETSYAFRRYKTDCFGVFLDTWTDARPMPFKKTTDKELKRMANHMRQRAEAAQNSGRIVVQTRQGSRGYIARRPTDIVPRG